MTVIDALLVLWANLLHYNSSISFCLSPFSKAFVLDLDQIELLVQKVEKITHKSTLLIDKMQVF